MFQTKTVIYEEKQAMLTFIYINMLTLLTLCIPNYFFSYYYYFLVFLAI